jgi:torulene dioxygenase
MFNYNLAFGPTPTYKIFSAKPATGEVEILATISESSVKGAYIHSMFCTPSFVILCVWNAFFKPYGLSVLWNRNLMDAMSPFDPESKAIWLVVDRHHQRGVVKRFESPAFFAFHTTNSWEEHSQDGAVDIICELFQFPNTDILHKFYYENLVSDEKNVKVFNASVWSKKGQGGELARYTLPGIPLLKTAIQTTIGTAERMLTIPSPNAGDLQHCNPHYHLRPHRYVWSVLDRGKSSFIDGLGKTDTLTKTCTVWESHGVTPCEPVFIPAPDATAEDEGVILTVAYIGKVDTSVLLCLDARTMKEIGRAEVGTTVGLGFHGTHLSALG